MHLVVTLEGRTGGGVVGNRHGETRVGTPVAARPGRRRPLVAAVAALAAVLVTGLVPATAATRAEAAAAVPVLVLEGRGYGHGVGLSQHGARWMAEGGAGTEDILATFYPGTALGHDGGDVRVSVHASSNGSAVLSFASGGEVRSAPEGAQAPGFPVSVGPGGQVAITAEGGGYRVSPVVGTQAAGRAQPFDATATPRPAVGSPASRACIPLLGPCPDPDQPPPPGGCLLGCAPPTTAPPGPAPGATPGAPPSPGTGSPGAPVPAPGQPAPPPDAPEPPAGPPASPPASVAGGPVWAVPASGTVGVTATGRSYRGMIEATAAGGPLRLVNHLDVDTYLQGLGEMPGSWPSAALQAQTIAARTYALRSMSFTGELCDTQACQVYLGASGESGGQVRAVQVTRGEVLTYGGALASTVYSADAGGISATTLEGFGTPDGVYPYLTTVRYDTPDPLPWRSEVALSDIGARFGYPGTVTSASISGAGPSGRALQVTLDGDAGPAAVDGLAFADALGLRSTLFTLSVTAAEVAPPIPEGGAAMQVLPEDAAAIAAATLASLPRGSALLTRAELALGPVGARGVRGDGGIAAPPAWLVVVAIGLLTTTGLAHARRARSIVIPAGVRPTAGAGHRRSGWARSGTAKLSPREARRRQHTG